MSRTTSTDRTADERTAQAWDRALDELEAWIVAGDSVALDPTGDALLKRAWIPPIGLGPLPEDQHARAASLLARQRVMQRALEDARDSAARQLAAVAAMSANADRTAAPAYVDQAM